jgi:D-tyrosyl-tRNA(Tyr) deacylase
MRALIQRVTHASVKVEGEIVGAIDAGLLIFLGVGQHDQAAQADWLAHKIANLRIFSDAEGKMNRSVLDTGGSLLVVSQFTLYGDIRRGFRPSFGDAALPAAAIPLIDQFIAGLKKEGVPVATGRFGAHMEVELLNDGPVTIWLEREPEEENQPQVEKKPV